MQAEYNAAHGITPKTIKKDLMDYFPKPTTEILAKASSSTNHLNIEEVKRQILKTEQEMRKKANALDFEEAARLRDEMKRLQEIEIMLS